MRIRLTLLFLALLAGCASPSIDYQPGTDFGAYQRVTLVHGDGAKSIDDARVIGALNKHLPAHGLTPTEAEASLQVRYRFVEYSHYDVNEVFWGFGASRGNVGVGVSTPVSADETKQYRLVLEMVDTAAQQVVWKASSANGLPEDARSEKRSRWIDQQVEKMLAAYPPASAP